MYLPIRPRPCAFLEISLHSKITQLSATYLPSVSGKRFIPGDPHVVGRSDRSSNLQHVLAQHWVLHLVHVALRVPTDVSVRHAELENFYERILPN